MVSSTRYPVVHLLGSQNVYGRAEGIQPFFVRILSKQQKVIQGRIHGRKPLLDGIKKEN